MDTEHPIHIAAYDEPEALEHGIPGVRMRVTPLARAPFHARLATWVLDGIVFQAGRCSPALIEFATGADVSVLQIPLLNRQHLVLNGRLAAGQVAGLYGGGASLHRANHLPGTYGTLVVPMQAADALLCPPPGLALTRPRADGLLTVDPGAWRQAAAIITACIDAADTGMQEAPRRGLRASLLEAARGVLAHGTDREPVRRLHARRGWVRIVAGAEAFLHAHPARPIYTEQLCAALAISPASLGEAFRQVLGIAPHRFLKLRRMAMVRAALGGGEGPAPLVKSVALDHGFWHMGQFALDYRVLYGETPTETLARRGPGGAARASGPGILTLRAG